MRTGCDKVFIKAWSDRIYRLQMRRNGANCRLNLNFMLLFSNNRPKFQCLILTGRDYHVGINQYRKSTDILRMTSVVCNKLTPSQRVNLMKFYHFIFSCCEKIRMEIFHTKYCVLMPGDEWDKLHCMPVKNLGIAAVCNNDYKITLVFLFSAWFGVFNINDLIIEADYRINSGECFWVNKSEILFCRHNNELLIVGKGEDFHNSYIYSLYITSDLVSLVIEINAKNPCLLPSKYKNTTLQVKKRIHIA